jgi:hypothetical protein
MHSARDLLRMYSSDALGSVASAGSQMITTVVPGTSLLRCAKVGLLAGPHHNTPHKVTC